MIWGVYMLQCYTHICVCVYISHRECVHVIVEHSQVIVWMHMYHDLCTYYDAIHTFVCVYMCHCECVHVTVEHSQVMVWVHVYHDVGCVHVMM